MYDRQMWFESPIQPAVTAPTGGLAGLGSVNQLAVDMPDQTVRIFYGVTQDLGNALGNGGKPQRPYNFAQYNVQSPQWGLVPNGYYNVQTFMGGFLLDGCPLNVIFGQGWQAGQQAALQQAGINPTCPQVLPMQSPVPIVTVNPLSTSTVPGATYSPPIGPSFTPTTVTGGIVTGPSAAAPQTTVYSSQAPALPTGEPAMVGQPSISQELPSWVPFAAVALIAAVALRRKG